MPKLNFNGVDEVDDFPLLPDGSYLCRLAEVEEGSTRSGDEMWRLRFVVENGPNAGRYIFDKMAFTEAAMRRVKLICSRLGLDADGELDLTPDLIKGRTCMVSVLSEEYTDDQGQTKRYNVVPFAGYDYATPPAGNDQDGEGDLPF